MPGMLCCIPEGTDAAAGLDYSLSHTGSLLQSASWTADFCPVSTESECSAMISTMWSAVFLFRKTCGLETAFHTLSTHSTISWRYTSVHWAAPWKPTVSLSISSVWYLRGNEPIRKSSNSTPQLPLGIKPYKSPSPDSAEASCPWWGICQNRAPKCSPSSLFRSRAGSKATTGEAHTFRWWPPRSRVCPEHFRNDPSNK